MTLCAGPHVWRQNIERNSYICADCGVEVTQEEFVDYEGPFLSASYILNDIVNRRVHEWEHRRPS